ncbi:MAG: HIT family protein, partial [Aquisalinus sp.]|nr:HIT family protein [Aquisalinus sp.]
MQIPAYDPENIFAKIIRGEIPNTTVYEDDDVLSFMDLFPQSEGHTLVIPKNVQAVNFLDIDAETLGVLIQRTQMIAKAVNQALDPEGIRIVQFNGEAAGQTVFHLHFHIIPMWQT